jgi:peptidoglycan/LPS O-acetylase OafA/YrhL
MNTTTLPNSAPTTKGSLRKDIQALRALAVLLVVAYHANLPVVHGGFLGVDVFFVISGFVITQSLDHSRATTFWGSITDFYAKRIRRIMPAATLIIIATVFASYHWLSYITGGHTANDATWVAAFVGNYRFSSQQLGYFTSALPHSTLQQYWSLAVEEQFYVVWPLLFFGIRAVLRRRSQTSILAALSVVIVASLSWCLVQTHQNATAAFFSPFTRAWELALGALVAIVVPQLTDRAPRTGLALSFVGLAGIVVPVWFLSATSLWPGANALLPVVGTALVLAGGTLRLSSRDHVLVDNPVVQWFGLISYSLYLVHWPVLQIPQQYSFSGVLPRSSELALVALSVALAAVMYYAVENPLRKAQWLQVRWRTFVFGAVLIGLTYAAIFWHLHNY